MQSSGFSLVELLLVLTLASLLLMLTAYWYSNDGVKQRSELWLGRDTPTNFIQQRWQRRVEQQQRWQQNGFY